VEIEVPDRGRVEFVRVNPGKREEVEPENEHGTVRRALSMPPKALDRRAVHED
jgi:hypothetical protein